MPFAFSYGLPRSSRNHYVDPPGFATRLLNSLHPSVQSALLEGQARASSIVRTYRAEGRKKGCTGIIFRFLRFALSLRSVLILLWVFTLWWGERRVFRDSVDGCRWEKWERWVCDILSPCVPFPERKSLYLHGGEKQNKWRTFGCVAYFIDGFSAPT